MTTETKLSMAARLDEIIRDCFPENTTDKYVEVDGVTMNVGFAPAKLDKHREEIRGMCNEMHDDFHAAGGGGQYFLRLCLDKRGNQWGDHRDMQALCLLAIGSGLAKWLMPRELWATLPGGMPYIVFDTSVPT